MSASTQISFLIHNLPSTPNNSSGSSHPDTAYGFAIDVILDQRLSSAAPASWVIPATVAHAVLQPHLGTYLSHLIYIFFLHSDSYSILITVSRGSTCSGSLPSDIWPSCRDFNLS
ncbi:unnamed protein product [Dibothriocephalus latus]|uniref:Uncharacterized protein n=1 Tax=Dibothriocephalus latus TaxID=60516 RepID=A0A3P7NT22_DIBLA|nr:unnamed protein product [Dibothriocephalus latus]